jgi:hypothetical protein
MGKNIPDKSTPTATLQSYRFKEKWGKKEATLANGKTTF